MAFILADRIRETSQTEGTGTYSLLGNVSGFRTFSSGVGGGGQCTYVTTMGSQWEVGVGTVSAGALARTVILASSNAGSAVNWTAGTKDIRLDVAATFATQMYRGSVFWGSTSGGSANAQTVTLSPAIYSYWAGLTIVFLAGFTNTTTMTLNANGVGADALRPASNVNMPAGGVTTGTMYMCCHDGTRFRLVSPQT